MLLLSRMYFYYIFYSRFFLYWLNSYYWALRRSWCYIIWCLSEGVTNGAHGWNPIKETKYRRFIAEFPKLNSWPGRTYENQTIQKGWGRFFCPKLLGKFYQLWKVLWIARSWNPCVFPQGSWILHFCEYQRRIYWSGFWRKFPKISGSARDVNRGNPKCFSWLVLYLCIRTAPNCNGMAFNTRYCKLNIIHASVILVHFICMYLVRLLFAFAWMHLVVFSGQIVTWHLHLCIEE